MSSFASLFVAKAKATPEKVVPCIDWVSMMHSCHRASRHVSGLWGGAYKVDADNQLCLTPTAPLNLGGRSCVVGGREALASGGTIGTGAAGVAGRASGHGLLTGLHLGRNLGGVACDRSSGVDWGRAADHLRGRSTCLSCTGKMRKSARLTGGPCVYFCGSRRYLVFLSRLESFETRLRQEARRGGRIIKRGQGGGSVDQSSALGAKKRGVTHQDNRRSSSAGVGPGQGGSSGAATVARSSPGRAAAAAAAARRRRELGLVELVAIVVVVVVVLVRGRGVARG